MPSDVGTKLDSANARVTTDLGNSFGISVHLDLDRRTHWKGVAAGVDSDRVHPRGYPSSEGSASVDAHGPDDVLTLRELDGALYRLRPATRISGPLDGTCRASEHVAADAAV